MRRAGTDGYILVAVLGVMLGLAGLVAAASLVAHSAIIEARVDRDAAALDGLVRGGVELAANQLFAAKRPIGAVSGVQMRLGEATITATVHDEAAKIDLNGASDAVLASAFRSANLDAGRTASLVARMARMRSPAGSEASPATPSATGNAPTAPPQTADNPVQQSPSGKTAAPARQQRRTGFRSVAEFIGFAALDSEESHALEPMLTVFNPDGKVDVLTADRRVLLALPDMSDALVDTLIADRDAAAADDGARLKSGLGRQRAFVKFEPGPAFTVEVDAALGPGRGGHGAAVIARSQNPTVPYYLLEWLD